jgi:hypothetical protein
MVHEELAPTCSGNVVVVRKLSERATGYKQCRGIGKLRLT